MRIRIFTTESTEGTEVGQEGVFGSEIRTFLPLLISVLSVVNFITVLRR
jgi:hypothetical protein